MIIKNVATLKSKNEQIVLFIVYTFLADGHDAWLGGWLICFNWGVLEIFLDPP